MTTAPPSPAPRCARGAGRRRPRRRRPRPARRPAPSRAPTRGPAAGGTKKATAPKAREPRGAARAPRAAAPRSRRRFALPKVRVRRAADPSEIAVGARGRAPGDTRTRTITLPRVTIPSALTGTGARIIVLTGERIKPLADSTRRVWHPVLEVLRWVSPLGWTILLVGLVAWWLTARYQWVELSMVAATCLVLVLACLALAVGRAKVRIRVDVEPTRVTVGDPATGSHRGRQRLQARDAAAPRRAARRRHRGPLHPARPRLRPHPRGAVRRADAATAASSPSARRRRSTATRSASSAAPSRGPSAPSSSSTR